MKSSWRATVQGPEAEEAEEEETWAPFAFFVFLIIVRRDFILLTVRVFKAILLYLKRLQQLTCCTLRLLTLFCEENGGVESSLGASSSFKRRITREIASNKSPFMFL